MLAEIRKLAEGPIAASFTDADRNPPVFDPATHSVTLPESFKKSVKALEDGEWFRLDLPERARRLRRPARADLGAPSRWCSARTPPSSCTGRGPRSPPSCTSWARRTRSGWPSSCSSTTGAPRWCSPSPTPAPTSAPARTKAVQQPDGSWHIEGVKRFITSAEHDLSDNIIHLVLARPEGAKAGTKGLSLFVVPKFHVDLATGELGERNGAYVTNVEKKMGLKVSTTCELTFGATDVPAQGWLVGEVHDGIAQMFKVIEHARMFVGAKAIATLSAGYQVALDYAKTRVQGADLTATSKDAPAGDDHPPPRRPPLADAAEVLRRGHAGAVPVRRRASATRSSRPRRPARATASRRRWPSGSTTCCCRS